MRAAEELLWQVETLNKFHEETHVIIDTVYERRFEFAFHQLPLPVFNYNIVRMYTRIELRLERDSLGELISRRNEENKFFTRRAICFVSRTFIHSETILHR